MGRGMLGLSVENGRRTADVVDSVSKSESNHCMYVFRLIAEVFLADVHQPYTTAQMRKVFYSIY